VRNLNGVDLRQNEHDDDLAGLCIYRPVGFRGSDDGIAKRGLDVSAPIAVLWWWWIGGPRLTVLSVLNIDY